MILFYSVSALYIFAMTSLGIAIAVVARNLSQAVMIMLLILQPMLFLSGAWNPPEAMNPWMHKLSFISPMRYFIDFGFGVLLKGNGLSLVAWDIVGIRGIRDCAIRVFTLVVSEERRKMRVGLAWALEEHE